MSTKTITKRIALVAASALAIGGFSAVSANAVGGTGAVGSIAVSKFSAAKSFKAIANGSAYASAASVVTAVGTSTTPVVVADIGKALYSTTSGFIGTIASVGTPAGLNNSFTLAAAPLVAVVAAGNGAAGNLFIGAQVTTKTSSTVIDPNGINALTVTSGAKAALVVDLGAAEGVSLLGETRLSLPGAGVIATSAALAPTDTESIIPFTVPTMTAGTYNFTVSYSVGGAFLATATDQIDITVAITISGAAALSPASAIVLQAQAANPGDAQGSVAAAQFTTTLDAAPYSARATLGNTISEVEVILLNNDQTAAGQKNAITATISGSGFVAVDEAPGATVATLRSATFANTGTNNVMWVHLSTDGTTGPGTVTISVTDAVTGATTTIGTKSFTSTGAVAKIAVSSSNFTIGAPGKTSGQTGAQTVAGSTGDAFNTAANTQPAFVVKTTDSAGNATNIGTITGVPSIVSSDLSVISGGVCVKDITAATVAALVGQGGTVGFYNCTFTTAANAASGSKATLTIKTADPADATGATFLTTTYAVSVGSTTVAKEVISTNAASYTPGAPMVVTVKATDSKGNPVADGTASPALTANKALGVTATALAAGFYNAGAYANATSVAKSTLFAPSLAGPFIITGTGTDAASTAITATATVGSVNDAQIASLITKINALAALIAKIQKKLGIK